MKVFFSFFAVLFPQHTKAVEGCATKFHLKKRMYVLYNNQSLKEQKWLLFPPCHAFKEVTYPVLVAFLVDVSVFQTKRDRNVGLIEEWQKIKERNMLMCI